MRHLWLYSLILLLAPLAVAARAADGDAAPASGGAAKPPPAIEEVKPELYYLRDKDNHLVPAPGFSLDDFARYYRLRHGLAPSENPPRYSIEQLTLAGQPRGDRVELTATVAIVSLVSDWVRVPLRFDQCVLREAAEYHGSGEHLVQAAPDGGGLVCWVRGEPQSEHRLTLKLLAPLAGDARDGRLQLSLPRAAASRLSLRVPLPQATATASPGLAPEVVPADGSSEPPVSAGGLPGAGGDKSNGADANNAKPAPAAESEIRVLGIGGDCWVAWHAPDQSPAAGAADLEAAGAMLVKIDGRSITTDATLTVRGFGAEFDHFQIQLPPGSQLVAGHTPGYTLTPIAADPAKKSPNGPTSASSSLKPQASSLLAVRLDHKTTGPVEIHLTTERAFDVTKPDEPLELAGFAVPEAIPHRQWGYLAVAVAGDWQVTWSSQTRVRRISELPPPLEQKGVVAGFEYYGQPCSLVVRVAPRRTRVTVEPQYTYTVRSDETRLAATFDYAIRGAKLFDLQIEMPGWEIDRVLPAGQIDANAVNTSADGVVTLPLVEPTAGDIEVAVWAHRPHPRGAKTLDWALPRPRADAVGPAEVAVIPAGNVSLISRPDKMVGMSPVAPGWPATAEPADSRQPLLFHADRPGARFAADLAARPREVSIDASEQVTAGADACAVRETLDYMIRYEPLDQLTLEMPRSVWDSDKPSFVVDQQALQPRPIPMPAMPAGAGAADAGRIRVQAPLRRPALGPLRLEISYTAAHAHLSAESGVLLTVPLVSPRDGRIASQAATVSGAPSVQIESRGGGWEATEAVAGRGQSPLHVAAPPTVESLPLALTLVDEHPPGATFVDRAWIQTWLTDGARQDRIVYLLTTAAAEEQLALPEGVLPGDVEVSVDGQPQAPATGTNGALVVRLPIAGPGATAAADEREHRIELRYVLAGHEPRAGRLSLDAPRFDGRVRVLREYWELILSSDEHLVAASSNLSSENEWTWRSDYLGYQRVPLKNDRQLEQWVDSAAAAAVRGAPDAAAHPFDPPPRANRYLFSAEGSLDRFDVVVARRWVVLLAGAAIALAAGLALLYWPALRRPGLLVAAIGLLLLAGIAFPDLSLLAAQPALAGAALVALAWALRRMSARAVAAPIVTAPLSARLDRTSIRISRFAPAARPAEPDGRAPATTTASVALDSPSPEPNA